MILSSLECLKAQQPLTANQSSSECMSIFMDSLKRSKHPALGTSDQFEKWLQQKIQENKNTSFNKKEETVYTIPVIVHVIHNGEAIGTGSNISDDQIQSQINTLTANFRKQSSILNKLSKPPFDVTNWSTMAVDCGVQFCLAEKDTNGNTLSTAGIERLDRNVLGFSAPPYSVTSFYIENTIKPVTIWNPNKYLNLWVVNLSGNILGYSTFPQQSTLLGLDKGGLLSSPTSDGVVMHYKNFGTVGNLNTGFITGAICTHEVGHWLGLKHLWGDISNSCNGTDYCDDTPAQKSASASNNTFPKISCNNGPWGNMYVNFMDYGLDSLLTMFTDNQKTRVRIVLENSPMRVSLVAQTTSCSVATKIDENQKTHISIYPNPSAGHITITLNHQEVVSIKVIDALGKVVEKIENISADQMEVNIERSGLFFIQVNTPSTSIIEKVIVETEK